MLTDHTMLLVSLCIEEMLPLTPVLSTAPPHQEPPACPPTIRPCTLEAVCGWRRGSLREPQLGRSENKVRSVWCEHV